MSVGHVHADGSAPAARASAPKAADADDLAVAVNDLDELDVAVEYQPPKHSSHKHTSHKKSEKNE